MLDNIPITDALAMRPAREPDSREQRRAIFEIASQMSENPASVLQARLAEHGRCALDRPFSRQIHSGHASRLAITADVSDDGFLNSKPVR